VLLVFVSIIYAHRLSWALTAQTIRGVSLAQFNSNTAAYTKTLKQAIASGIAGCTEDSITELKVTAAASSAVAVIAAATSSLRRAARLLADSAIQISYKVTVQGTTLSASTLAGQLKGAVSSGAFDAALQSSAANNGATGLQTATSDEPTTDTGDGDDDEAPPLSVGGIVGVVVGGVSVLVIVTALLAFFCMRQRSVAHSVHPAGVPMAQQESAPTPTHTAPPVAIATPV
jgi:hypothetical protein